MQGLVNRGRRVAAPERVVVLNSRAADKRIRDRDCRRPGFDVNLGEPRRSARLVARARGDCEQSLAVEHHILFDKEGLVGKHRRDIVFARNIRGRQNGDNSGRGDAASAIDKAPHRLEGQFSIGGQEHFYLEGQASFAFPGEADEMTVHASTQDPTETQHIVARVLGIPDAFVTVETRRMGGGFGGKESQACAWAAIAALAARVTGRPCKIRLDRDDDFALTGKRHDFRADWRVGYDDQGVVAGYEVALNARCGCSADLSPGVCDRAMFHAGNGYWLPEISILTRRLKTNTVSNTAFRGFGGPQGMIAIERVMDAIARDRGLDPLDVRKANLLRPGFDRTPYDQTVEDFGTQREIIEDLEVSSNYRARRERIAAFNTESPIIKRGIALTPVMFGISFTLIPLNQATALVHVYSDGSIHLNHGGTEMGQGLFTKARKLWPKNSACRCISYA